LKTLADTVYNDGERAMQRASDQSQADWGGGGGDAFRRRLKDMRGGAQELDDRLTSFSTALSDFANILTAVKTKMGQARDIAEQGGLKANDDWIVDPDPSAADADQLRQAAAFRKAFDIANGARLDEGAAHDALEKACGESESELQELEKKAFWITLDSGARTVEGAVGQARKWWDVADENDKSLAKLEANIAKAIADGVPFPEDMAARATFESEQAGQAAKNAMENNAKLVLGEVGKDGKPLFGPLANAVSKSPASFFPEGSTAAEIAERFPYVGTAIAAADTGLEIAHAPNADDAAKDFAKGGASFGLGTDAFAATMAVAEGSFGWEAGPASAAAVAAAVGVGFGVDWVVDQIW
jgi:hypothetical protein